MYLDYWTVSQCSKANFTGLDSAMVVDKGSCLKDSACSRNSGELHVAAGRCVVSVFFQFYLFITIMNLYLPSSSSLNYSCYGRLVQCKVLKEFKTLSCIYYSLTRSPLIL